MKCVFLGRKVCVLMWCVSVGLWFCRKVMMCGVVVVMVLNLVVN